MQNKKLHIISFDNPFPPVYGGVIDVFYKIKALHELGIEIYLHCFIDEIKEENSVLKQYVKEVYYYKRNKKNIFKLLSRFPFAVVSRYHKALISNINNVEAPILFEGLQTTFAMHEHHFKNRKLMLRLHNLEANYFSGLAKSETNLAKRTLFGLEATKYKSYQKIISKFDATFTLSVSETNYVQEHFGNANYIPVFHGNETVVKLSEFGKFALYHGDLRMADNKRAVAFLIKVFKKIPDYKLVIASGCGADFVKNKIITTSNVSFVSIENQEHLNQLLEEAHLNVMLSFQQSGTKLKLINSLYKSRFCIINRNMVDDENVRNLCEMAESKAEFINVVNRLKNQPYLDNNRREKVLFEVLDDSKNAKKLMEFID
ncbi:MAG: hypothetical protein ABWZ56_08340 [Flavobacterium sp.]